MTNTSAGRKAGSSRTFTTRSPEETERFGERLASALLRSAGPAVVLLSGPLGAGKTCLVRGLARGLGCSTVPRSPTFALHLSYPGSRTLHHLDLYRLDLSGLPDLGLEDLFAGPDVVAVEWGERLASFAPEDALRVTLDPTGDQLGDLDRRVLVEGPAALVARLEEAGH